MNKYQSGKIYKIVGSNHNKIYVGSTISTLKRRFSQHKRNRGNCSAKQLLNDDKVEIILIEYFPCNSSKELKIRERYFYEKYDCINTISPYETPKEKTLRRQKSRQKYDNKEEAKIKRRKREAYLNSWGGNKQYHNNLLEISVIGDLQ
jgi:hypothetical protein